MRYVIISLIMIMLSIGCGKAIINIDPAVQPYVDRFKQASIDNHNPVSITDLTVKFGPAPKDAVAYVASGTIAGSCTKTDGHLVVTLDKVFWDGSGEYDREQVLFHELGHCVLNLEHNLEMDGDMPKSIMYPINTDVPYATHKSYYLSELFSHQLFKVFQSL